MTIAFESSASNLVPLDVNGDTDVFVHDRSTGLTEQVSVDSSGTGGDRESNASSLSADGRIAGFTSLAANLVAGDTNDRCDVFIHDRSTGRTGRISIDSAGAQGDGDSGYGAIASDGQKLAFQSMATNLVAGDSNGTPDVFVHEICSTAASWSNYGAGFPGTYGVPSFTAQSNPVFGATITLDLANSYANPTFGLIIVGAQRALIHSGWGGDLLVDPSLVLPVSFSYGSDSFTGNIPDDPSLCGFACDLQAIEADPGAAKGVSFTPGLELVLGH
jgi:cold shock CspA family protein